MDTAAPIDRTIWSSLVEQLGDRLLEISETYIRESQERLAQIQSAIVAEDAKGLNFSANSLKSIALTMGALPLAAYADKLVNADDISDRLKLEALLQHATNEFHAVREFMHQELGIDPAANDDP